jgi:hypothetical protein
MLLAGGVAAGLAAGYVAFKYEKEIIEGLSKLTGMGKDFALEQKESLADMMAEAQDKVAGAPSAPPVVTPGTDTAADAGLPPAA